MAAIALTTAAAADRKLNIIESIEQHTLVAAAALTAGDPVRLDTAGKLVKALGTTAPNANAIGIAIRTVVAGEAVTVLSKGKVDGFDLSGRAFGDTLYVADAGGPADAAGTVSKAIGRVFPGTSNLLADTAQKILHVEL